MTFLSFRISGIRTTIFCHFNPNWTKNDHFSHVAGEASLSMLESVCLESRALYTLFSDKLAKFQNIVVPWVQAAQLKRIAMVRGFEVLAVYLPVALFHNIHELLPRNSNFTSWTESTFLALEQDTGSCELTANDFVNWILPRQDLCGIK